MVEVGVVIVSFNTRELTDKCLNSIFKSHVKTSFKVIVVDNASSDQTVEMIKKKYPQVMVVESGSNLGFSKGNNLGVSKLPAKYYLFLNSDTEVEERSIDVLIEFAKANNYQIASCQLVNPDGTFQPPGGDLPTFLPLFFWLSGLDDLFQIFGLNLPSFHQPYLNYYQKKQIGWVAGAVFLISKDALERLDGWDRNIFMYAEDVDLCWRAKLMGIRVGWTDRTQIKHIGGASSKNPKFKQWLGELTGLLYLYRKNYGLLGLAALKLLIYLFTMLRIIGFALLGNLEYARTYGALISKI